MSEDFHMLSQPLLTEDGFVNEACMNELAAAINGMPETHERLAGCDEWSSKRLTGFRDITAALAYWLVHQFACCDNDETPPPAHAPGLEEAISFLTACIRPKFDKFGWAQMSLCDINKLCWEVLPDLPRFKSWNEEATLGRHWLDLSALLHNVCLTIRDDRRKSDAFDRRFDAEWAAREKAGNQ